MNTKLAYWLWLYRVLGPCSVRFRELFYRYDYIEDIYENRRSPELLAMLAPNEAARCERVTLETQYTLIEQCEKRKISVLCYADDEYPERLRQTRIPPMILFVTGEIRALRTECISGVGSRRQTSYGRQAVRMICEPLVKAGFTLVSGLAYGTDVDVHRAALRGGGLTVAVLGTPINETFPAEHEALRREIEEAGGCVVSEYAPGMKYQKSFFPRRNRIISGLSRGVIIFEAARKSGTMITAGWALEDGREVFAVPGNITSLMSEGTNDLIRQGASPVSCAQDVLDGIGLETIHAEKSELPKPPRQQEKFEGVRGLIAGCLEDEERALDDIAALTGLAPQALLAELTMMELDGVVELLPGSRYRMV